MKSILIFFLVFSISCFGQNNGNRGTISVKKVDADTSIYATSEEMAKFPGGSQAFLNYISSNIVYPDSAKINGISGICYIMFTINTDGSISNVKILRGISGCSECDMEARRVIMNMPKWSPAKNKGTAVRVQYNIPIKFTLQ